MGWLKNLLHIVPNLAQGLLYSVMTNQIRDLEEQIRRGNSPNRVNLLLTRVGLALLPILAGERFVPTEADISGTPERIYKEKISNGFLWLASVNLVLTLTFEYLHRKVSKLPPNNFFKQAVKKIHDNLPNLYFYTNIIVATIAIYMGAWLLPASFLFFNAMQIIQRRRLYSDAIHHQIDNFLFWGAALTGVMYGNLVEQIFFTVDLIGRSSQVLENASYYLIKLLKTPASLISNNLKKELDILGDRLAPHNPLKFQFHANAKTFHERLKGISESSRLRVNKLYVQQSKDTLPLASDGVDSLNLLKIFNSDAIQSKWPIYYQIIVDNIQADWQLSEKNIDLNDRMSCLAALYKGLEDYINEIKSGTLPGTVPGSTDRLNRYLNHVTDMIQKAIQEQKYDLVIRTIIKLGIEGGNNCSIGKARALEEAHRMLINENTNGNVPPEARIANILQLNREHYFQSYVTQSYVYNFIFNLLYHREDTHGYNEKIAIIAPRLGLPSLSAKVDLETHSDRNDFIFTLMSFCEQRFWRQTTVHTIQGEVQAAIMGTHQFTAQDVQRWYENFLTRHQIGSEEEQADIAAEFGDKAPTNFIDGRNVIRPDFLTLMLLDMGVLYLEGKNSWGEPILAEKKEQQTTLSVHNALTYCFGLKHLPSNENNTLAAEAAPIKAAKHSHLTRHIK